MTHELVLPIRDEAEVITARTIGELPQHLDDPDEREIAREALAFVQEVAAPQRATVGQAAQVLEDFNPSERRGLLEVLRRRALLPSLHEIQQMRTMEVARMRAPREGPVRLGVNQSGGVVDLDEVEEDAARIRASEASRAARREAELIEAAAEAEQLRAHQEALDEQARTETPRGIPAP